jgi:serine/threonine protein kinase
MIPLMTSNTASTSPTKLQMLPIHRGQCWYAPSVADRLGLKDSSAVSKLIDRMLAPEQKRESIKKEASRSSVDWVEMPSGNWIIKTYHMPAWITWFYQCVRATPSWREWRASFAVEAAGCRACPPLALVHDLSRGVNAQCLIMPYIEGRSLGQLLRRWSKNPTDDSQTPQLRLRLAVSMGDQIAALMRAGLINRDYKPANLMVDPACQQGREPVMIDPLGVRARVGQARRLRMLVTLLRTSLEAGSVSTRECVALGRALLKGEPGLGAGQKRRLRWLADQVVGQLPDQWRQRLLQSTESCE